MSLIGSFTGSDAKRALDSSKAAATGYLNSGETNALNATKAGYEQGQGYLNPYAQNGGRANALYADATGVNGADTQRSVMQNYAGSDPFRQWNMDQTSRMIAQRGAAQGFGGSSGTTQLALTRAGLERGSQDWQQYLQHLQNQSGQGFQAAGQQAGYANAYGNNNANIIGGFAQQHAGNEINYGNASAANSNVLAQNILGAGALAAKAFGVGGFAPGGGGGGGANAMSNTDFRMGYGSPTSRQ